MTAEYARVVYSDAILDIYRRHSMLRAYLGRDEYFGVLLEF